MRITARNSCIAALIVSTVVLAADATPFVSLAKLATALSENDSGEALSYFDSHLKNYGAIEANLDAIVAQADVTCAIDVVTDEEAAGGVHKLDLDWYMTLKSQGDDPQIERRRERVQVEMRQIGGRWKITGISSPGILDPIRLR